MTKAVEERGGGSATGRPTQFSLLSALPVTGGGSDTEAGKPQSHAPLEPVAQEMPCSECDGSGECPNCGGSGEYSNRGWTEPTECGFCWGTGACQACIGKRPSPVPVFPENEGEGQQS